MIKISKNLLLNPVQIRVSKFKCNFDNIAKIAKIFNWKWVVVTIDSLKNDSSLLSLVKNQGIKYLLK